jgi:hypothetical protein
MKEQNKLKREKFIQSVPKKRRATGNCAQYRKVGVVLIDLMLLL